jgi:phosphoglycolate phosphatase-like HAD superfamily hydrolase
MQVILFDIDGTLLSTEATQRDEGRRYLQAIRDVTGKEPVVVPSRFAGMVDFQICKVLLTELGLDENQVNESVPKVVERMGVLYREMRKQKVLNAGVKELLSILSKSSNHTIGVLTGNISAIAEVKLTMTGIMPYFAEKFYSDGYYDRKSLVEDAVTTCVAKYKLSERTKVLVVGETPLDIAAANAAKATSIAIASGVFSDTQLSQAGARWVFSSLSPSKELLTALEIVG